MPTTLVTFRVIRKLSIPAVILLALYYLLPYQFGGRTGYVVVNGTSMLPTLHRGDFTVLLRHAEYHVSDIVAYHHPDIGVVIHRIVEVDRGRFVLKGDNNSWNDAHQPHPEAIIGRVWLSIPGVGMHIEIIRNPIILTLFSVGLGVMIIAPLKKQSGKPRRPGQKTPPIRSVSSLPVKFFQPELALLCGIIALIALALGVFTFATPSTREIEADIEYSQSGVFSYTAPAPDGIYDLDQVQTGDPVYLHMTCEVAVSFDYSMLSEQPSSVSGTYALNAILRDANGWKRTFEIVEERPFQGSKASMKGKIDLCAIQRLIDRVSQSTLIRQQTYILDLLPQIYINGELGGQNLDDSFSPALSFHLDPYVLKLTSTGECEGSQPCGGIMKPLITAKLKGTRVVPNTLSLLSLRIPITAGRMASALLFLALSAGALSLGMPLLEEWRKGGAARLRIQYPALITDILDCQIPEGAMRVQLACFDDLARLAEKCGMVVLQNYNAGSHFYYVLIENTVYQFNLQAGPELTSSEPDESG